MVSSLSSSKNKLVQNGLIFNFLHTNSESIFANSPHKNFFLLKYINYLIYIKKNIQLTFGELE